ncbi:uncharacterized protein J7T54_006516 [Emericellopsis cladophorae]|uniref:Zn(2)-C6 fungal-type domain-containing protein n=1 Tax=Emericellopsis cladophorae TaxID=2686198 RepID=A0A9P9Y6T0_9HYPO|nr:uncharacterized protein J7T54_006516 [Emericellopsis cladophorae]KAI6784471.1 hypothetical protein J7T54_006516 [Emericellopsis cladophorae]
MDPGPPDSKRQRISPWSTASHQGNVLPRPHSTTNPLPPVRTTASHHHPSTAYPPYSPHRPVDHHHQPPPPPPPPQQQHHQHQQQRQQAQAPPPLQPHSSAPPTPLHHPSAGAPPLHPESTERRKHDQEPYAPMNEHYQHQHHAHQHQSHHPPASPARNAYHPYPPREPASVKREHPAEDPHRPNSTGHAPEGISHPSHPASNHHHSLPPPANYPDGQPRHLSYDNGSSMPPTPGGYRPPQPPPPPPPPASYGPPTTTPIPTQGSYESQNQYPYEPAVYNVAYSVPSKKKNTRASQACDQCRTLKAKCDETKPCKTCRDKGLECKYRDPMPKATDKAQADLLDGVNAIHNTLTALAEQFSSFENRLVKVETKVDTNFTQGAAPPLFKASSTNDEGIKTRPQSPSLPNGASGYYPQDYPSNGTMGPEQAAAMRMMAEDVGETEPGPPVPPGEPAIPINHTTLAGLLLEWPSIRDLTKVHVEREGIKYVSEYPIGLEQQRGPLIVYGRGEDSHAQRYSREPTESGAADVPDDASDAASPSDSADFGYLGGLQSPEPIEYRGGVLRSDGNPDFSESKVWSYITSFKANILNMHPILDLDMVDHKVLHFLASLPPAQPRSTKPHAAKPSFAISTHPQTPAESTGSKRKRTPEPDGPDDPPTPAPGRSGKPKRSIQNALVLTILALGKICQHRDSIPDAVLSSQAEPGTSASPMVRNGIPQSPTFSSPPGYSSQPHSSTRPSPRDHIDRTTHSRRGSFHGTSIPRSAGYSLKKNYDMIPGLEYFAYASDILGNFNGAYNSMDEVYANIFAGLYYGQLNRPLESFSFIHRAGHKLQVIMRPSFDKLRGFKQRSELITQSRYNRLALAFWTCLQLEADLIAELPMPPSGLLSYEEDMPHPNMSLVRGYDQYILDSYLGQLYLRTHLNSIHRMFYAPEDPQKPTQDKFKKVAMVAEAVSSMHWVSPNFAFSEEDPPATDILAARLRAKYWGARMITYRPFIRQILHFTHALRQHPSSPNPLMFPEVLQGTTVPAIDPEAKSVSDIDPALIDLASKGIKALVESTRAFHNLDGGRPIITNVFGTAHAQWGNLLVLSAAFREPVLQQFINEDLLKILFERTIGFLRQSATNSSSLRTDLHILEGLRRELFYIPEPQTSSSFSSSHASMHTPTMGNIPYAVNYTTQPVRPGHLDGH